jgi:hypothetical protein
LFASAPFLCLHLPTACAQGVFDGNGAFAAPHNISGNGSSGSGPSCGSTAAGGSESAAVGPRAASAKIFSPSPHAAALSRGEGKREVGVGATVNDSAEGGAAGAVHKTGRVTFDATVAPVSAAAPAPPAAVEEEEFEEEEEDLLYDDDGGGGGDDYGSDDDGGNEYY